MIFPGDIHLIFRGIFSFKAGSEESAQNDGKTLPEPDPESMAKR
jgi:hypothetical protein